MKKLKVGDKIMVTKELEEDRFVIDVGSIGTIKRTVTLDNGIFYWVDFCVGNCIYIRDVWVGEKECRDYSHSTHD